MLDQSLDQADYHEFIEKSKSQTQSELSLMNSQTSSYFLHLKIMI